MSRPGNVIVTERDLDHKKRKGRRNNRHAKRESTADVNEALIRKFLKKCKKERVVKEYIEKTSHYKSKSQKRREKRKRAIKRLKRETNKQHKFR